MPREDQRPPDPPPGPPPRRRIASLALRLLAAFLTLAVLFGGIVGWGLYRSRRALAQVRLLDEGYGDLAPLTANLRASQQILLILLDRILEDRDPTMTRDWLQEFRRRRPDRLAQLPGNIDRIRKLADSPDDQEAAARLAQDLDALVASAHAGDEALDRLLAALDGTRPDEARALLDVLKKHERDVDGGLRRLGDEAKRQVDDLSSTLRHDEARTFWMLLGLTLVAAGLAIGILVYVHSLVAPFRTLERAVQAVARGDFSGRIDLRRRDELGRLAEQFDLTPEAIRARDERLRALRQSEKLAALGRMAAHVTHEVRNPLSAIGLNTELLEEELARAGTAESALGMVRAIGREVERLTHVTQSYLSLARMPRPELAAADLGKVAREVVDFHRPEADAAEAKLECTVQDGLPEIPADAAQVRQVLANLLRNALEAIAGRPERVVRVEVKAERGGVELSVKDTGAGIPDEARARLFEPFFTTKPQGTGIGLAGSQQIAVAHGGTLTCDPEGPGTCFRLWLPGPSASAPAT